MILWTRNLNWTHNELHTPVLAPGRYEKRITNEVNQTQPREVLEWRIYVGKFKKERSDEEGIKV